MRALLFSISLAIGLMAIFALGCNDAQPDGAKTTTPPETSAVSNDSDHADLLAEVDKDALASALAANDVTLIEFTATW